MEEDKIKELSSSKMLAYSVREWWVYKVIKPFEDYCIEIEISPNFLTIFGFALNVIAGYLFSIGYFFFAGVVILLAGNFDFLDGRVARATKKTTVTGAYFDSVLDRYADAALYTGLIFFYRESWVMFFALAALLGSLMVSYTKSRAETLNIDCKVGLMQRPERIVYLGIGSLFSSLITVSLMPFATDPHHVPQHLLIGVIVILSVLTNYTALQRIIHVVRQIDKINEKNKTG
ncbi:MAG: CDP-alcohol phosphatidyltransferase family protein [Pseudomonadota bacterium]